MFNKFLGKSWTDFRVRGSFAYRLRKKRFDMFIRLMGDLVNQNLKILDSGGEAVYWNMLDEKELLQRDTVKIILLNIVKSKIVDNKFLGIVADAANLSLFKNSSVDIVFCHSVIQYITNDRNRVQIAKEINRISGRYFIQTPNYYFPIDPETRIFGFQFLPLSVKAFILRKFNAGHSTKRRFYECSKERAAIEKLFKLKELKKLFPDGRIFKEKFCFLTKSYVIYSGFNHT